VNYLITQIIHTLALSGLPLIKGALPD